MIKEADAILHHPDLAVPAAGQGIDHKLPPGQAPHLTTAGLIEARRGDMAAEGADRETDLTEKENMKDNKHTIGARETEDGPQARRVRGDLPGPAIHMTEEEGIELDEHEIVTIIATTKAEGTRGTAVDTVQGRDPLDE